MFRQPGTVAVSASESQSATDSRAARRSVDFFKSLARSTPHERTPADLPRWLQVPEPQLCEWMGSRPMWASGFDYLRFTIPKRHGGERRIEAPSDKLKALQRQMLWRLLAPLSLRPCAARPLATNCYQTGSYSEGERPARLAPAGAGHGASGTPGQA